MLTDDKDKSLDHSVKSALTTSTPIYDPGPFFPKDQHTSNLDSTTALQNKDDDKSSSSSFAPFNKDKGQEVYTRDHPYADHEAIDSSNFWDKDATTAKLSSTATENKDDKSSTDPTPFYDKDKPTSLSVVSTVTVTDKLTTPAVTASTSDSSPNTDKDKDKTSTSPDTLQTTKLQSSVPLSDDDKDMSNTATASRSTSAASVSSLPAKDGKSETSTSRAQSTYNTDRSTSVLSSDKDAVTEPSTSATHLSFSTASSLSKISSSTRSDNNDKDMTSYSASSRSTIYSSRVTKVSKTTSSNDKPGINISSDTVLSGSSNPIRSSIVEKSSRASSKTGSSKSSTTTIRKATSISTQSLTRTSQPPFLNASSSVVPLWTPTMLGNAYGGGYITIPSIYVTLGPTPKGSIHGIPPGYGSSTFSIGSSQISGSYISSSSAVMHMSPVPSNPASSEISIQLLSMTGSTDTSNIETDRTKISSSPISEGEKHTTQGSQTSTPTESGPRSTLSGVGSSLTGASPVLPRISTSMTTSEGSISGDISSGRSTSPNDITPLPTSSGRRASTNIVPNPGSADKDSTVTFGAASITSRPLSSLSGSSGGSASTSVLSSYDFEDKDSSLTPGPTSATNPPLSPSSMANPLTISGLVSLSNSNDKPTSQSASLPQASARSSISNDKDTASSYSTLNLIIDTFPAASPTLGTLSSGLPSASASTVETGEGVSSDNIASSRPGIAEPTGSSSKVLPSGSELSTGMTNSLPVSQLSGSNTPPFTSLRESQTQVPGNMKDSSFISFQPSTITSRDFSIESSPILSSSLYMTSKEEQSSGFFTSGTSRVGNDHKTPSVSGSFIAMPSSSTESFPPMDQGSMSSVVTDMVSMVTAKPSVSGTLSNDKGETGSEPSTTGALASSTTVEAPSCPFATASACPTPANSCCPYICTAEGVPFSYCSLTDVTDIFADGVGELQSCSRCPGLPAISMLSQITITSAVLPSLIPTTNGFPSGKDKPASDSTVLPVSDMDTPISGSSVLPTSSKDMLIIYSSVSMMAGSDTATITSSASLASSTLTCPEQSSFRVNCPATFSPCCAYVCGGKALPFGSSICLRSSGIPPVETCDKCDSSPATITSLISDTNKPTPELSISTAASSEIAIITSSASLETSTLNSPATASVDVHGGTSASPLSMEISLLMNKDFSVSPEVFTSGFLVSTQANAVSTPVLPANSEVSLAGSSPALMTVTSQDNPVLVGALGTSSNTNDNHIFGGLGSTVVGTTQGSSQVGLPIADKTSTSVVSTLAPNQVGGSPSELAGSDVGVMAQAASTPSNSLSIIGGPSEFGSTLTGEILASYLGLEATMSPASAMGTESRESLVTAATPVGNAVPSSDQPQTLLAEAATQEDTTDYNTLTRLGAGQPQVMPFQPTTTATGNVSIPFLPTTFTVEPFLGLAVKNIPSLTTFSALLVSLIVLF